MATELALELDTAKAGYTGGEPIHFSNFPGVWQPGHPIAVTELGYPSTDEALAAVKDLDLPLDIVKVDVGSAPMPARPNHLLSEEQQRILDLDAAANWPPTTHADADAAAAAANVEWPRATMKVSEKVEFLEQLRAGTETVADDADEVGA